MHTNAHVYGYAYLREKASLHFIYLNVYFAKKGILVFLLFSRGFLDTLA